MRIEKTSLRRARVGMSSSPPLFDVPSFGPLPRNGTATLDLNS
jgi:hypothetical protein